MRGHSSLALGSEPMTPTEAKTALKYNLAIYGVLAAVGIGILLWDKKEKRRR